MHKIAQELLDILVEALSDLVPGGRHARKAAGVLVRAAATARERDLLERIADQTFRDFYDAVGIDEANPGAAKSSAYDILNCIAKARITVDVLLDCDLSAERLVEHLQRFPADAIDGASAMRRGFYERGLQAFSVAMMQNALQLPGMEVSAMGRLLRNQRLLLTQLSPRKQERANPEVSP